MKRGILLLMLALCLMLSGCMSWMDGSYSSVYPYTERDQQNKDQIVSVAYYSQLRDALVEMVANCNETMLLNVAQMDPSRIAGDMQRAIKYVLESTPVGAYAVDEITYEQGTSGGQNALSVNVNYNHNRAGVLRMKHAENLDQVRKLVTDSLSQCESRVVLFAEAYRNIDIQQFVKDYAEENPNVIMEVPTITVNMYPEQGTARIMEIVFAYQSSRDSLRSMQSRVRPLFTSAELYVSGNHEDQEKYGQLYAFLMERHEYTIETSITPSYSLLVHGVGDSKAFATVYAAMCRRAGLDCMVVSGTWEGEPLFWNIVRDGEIYRHVDLLRCNRDGILSYRTDAQMTGYVWDYSAYPECSEPENATVNQESTEPEGPAETTEPDVPEETE